MAGDNNSASAALNFSESIRINSKEKGRNIELSPVINKNTTAASGKKQNGKYLSDKKLEEEVKATLSNYIGENCTLEQVRIRIRDNEKRGYVARVRIKGDQEIKVSEFLNGSFCKDKKISRFTLMTDDGKNSLSCDVNESGTRCYKVQNGPPVIMTINWYVGEKKCTVEIELGVNSLKIINLNEVTEEELNANKEIRISGKSLVEAVQSALQSTSPESRAIEQISSVIPVMQSVETVMLH